jgi:hypothetical protein
MNSKLYIRSGHGLFQSINLMPEQYKEEQERQESGSWYSNLQAECQHYSMMFSFMSAKPSLNSGMCRIRFPTSIQTDCNPRFYPVVSLTEKLSEE